MGILCIQASMGSSPEPWKVGAVTWYRLITRHWQLCLVPISRHLLSSHYVHMLYQIERTCTSRKWPSGLMCDFMLLSAPWFSQVSSMPQSRRWSSLPERILSKPVPSPDSAPHVQSMCANDFTTQLFFKQRRNLTVKIQQDGAWRGGLVVKAHAALAEAWNSVASTLGGSQLRDWGALLVTQGIAPTDTQIFLIFYNSLKRSRQTPVSKTHKKKKIKTNLKMVTIEIWG